MSSARKSGIGKMVVIINTICTIMTSTLYGTGLAKPKFTRT